MATSTELPHGWKRALRDYVRDVELALLRASRPDDQRLVDAVELLRANLRAPQPELGGTAPVDRPQSKQGPLQRSPLRMPWKQYLPAPQLEPHKAARARPRAKPLQRRDEDDD